MVAGGGGGGTDTELEDRPGGHGGGLNGGNGTDWSSWSNSGGRGGTQTSGGAAAWPCCYTATPGTFGTGGSGSGDLAAGAGGGGGWYGGGGGLFGAGGGGSGYLGSPCLTNTTSTSGFQPGNGVIYITYTIAPVNVVTTPSLICAGSSAVLTAGGMMSYSWSTGPNSASISVSPSANTAYTVEATTFSNCPAIGFATVNVTQGLPFLITQVSASDICPGEYVTLNAAGAENVTWSGGVSNNVPFQPTATAVYTVTGQNVCGTASSSLEIFVHTVSFSLASNPPAVCAGNNATLSASGYNLTYTWSPFLSLTCGKTVVVSPSSTTIYTVVARNDFGCTATKELTLQVNPVPVIVTTPGSATVCKTGTVLLTATGANSYTWTPGNLTGSSVVIAPHTSAVYKVTGSNSAGCTSTAGVAVSVNPIPAINVSATKTFVCAGTNVKLIASGATSYSWSNGQTGPYAYVTPTVPTTYTVTGYNSYQCASQKTIQVAVMQPPFSIPTSTSVCPGSYVTLYAGIGGSYSWSTGDCTSTITVKPHQTTWYTYAVSTHSNGITCTLNGSVQ